MIIDFFYLFKFQIKLDCGFYKIDSRLEEPYGV